MSYSVNSVNPVMLALAYYWKSNQSFGRGRGPRTHDIDRHTPPIPQPTYQRSRKMRRQPNLGCGCVIIILVLLLIAGTVVGTGSFVLWAQGQMQNYVTMHNGDTLVAQA